MSNFAPWFFRLRCIKHGRFFASVVYRNNGYKLHPNSSLNFCHAKEITISQHSTKLYGRFQYSNSTGLNYGGISKLHSWNFNEIARASRFQHNFDINEWMFLNGLYLRQFCRNFSNSRNHYQERNRTTAIYTVALVVVVLGVSYAAVPLYRIFCQASGLGGTVQQSDAGEKIKNMTTRKERLLTVRFNADKSATMQWAFKPQQSEVKVYPGETALAFYTAKNPTDTPITGISTYNVIPFEAGQYFNKIQCFCFEEQRLNPHEQVDMPVFFYIDPEFLEDPSLYKVDTITLSYTFFQAKEAHDFGIQ